MMVQRNPHPSIHQQLALAKSEHPAPQTPALLASGGGASQPLYKSTLLHPMSHENWTLVR